MRGLLLAAIVLVSNTVAAWADCRSRPSDLDSFGVEALGETAPTDMDAHAARTTDCNYQTDAVCAYVDKDGVWYSLVEGVLEWKSLRLAQLRPGYKIPFGLSANDTPLTVRAKMRSRRIVLADGPDNDRKGWSVLASDLCLINAKGEIFDVAFIFDQAGHLAIYETRIPSPRD